MVVKSNLQTRNQVNLCNNYVIAQALETNLGIILRTMDCSHGKPYSQFSLLEGIYANAVAYEVHRLCVERVVVVKSIILVKDNMTVS